VQNFGCETSWKVATSKTEKEMGGGWDGSGKSQAICVSRLPKFGPDTSRMVAYNVTGTSAGW
jgi:hypothetical protein